MAVLHDVHVAVGVVINQEGDEQTELERRHHAVGVVHEQELLNRGHGVCAAGRHEAVEVQGAIHVQAEEQEHVEGEEEKKDMLFKTYANGRGNAIT